MVKKLHVIFLIAILAFIWGNSLVPAEESGAASGSLLRVMNGMAAAVGLPEDLFTYYRDVNGDGILEPTDLLVRKMAHVTEYAVLAVLLWQLMLHRTYALPLAIAVAAVDELVIQRLSGRGSQVRDVLIDTLGAVLGIGVCALTSYIRARRKAS